MYSLLSEPLEFVMGTHTFEIPSYSLAKSTVGFGNYLKSSTFTVAGHQWVLEFYPNGRDEPETTYIAVGVRMLDPTEEVRASMSLALMDWYWSEWSNKCIFDLKVFKPEKFRWTVNDYIKQSDLKKNYFNDDVLKIKCDICVVVPPESQDIPRWELERSLDIVKHSSQCFQNGVTADVKFLVNGKTFLAHRWILAACSPVFRKVFLDTPIAEGEKIQEIVITEMKAITFDSLLYFIYTDSMPTEEDSNSRESILMTQRLLASAGRYKIHKLKSICVNKLCEGLTLDTVATTLVLAEEHNCTELREACVEFLLKNKNCVDRSLIDASDD